MKPQAHPFSLLVKPVSAHCNLDCRYCFYSRRNRPLPYPGSGRRMTVKTLKKMIASYMKTPQPAYIFSWQGGEPTLAGIEFYREALRIQKTYQRPGVTVANALQTNGTTIDAAFAQFLAQNAFLTGVSLDGPQDIHDRYRCSNDGIGSFNRVMEGIDQLRQNGVEFNILVLVTDANAQRGKDVYRFLREKGFHYHQYIPCVEFDSTGQIMPYAVTGEQWGEFLCDVYDQWVITDTHRVSIRLFDSILSLLTRGTPSICRMARECNQYFVVEYNGDIYPCDFYVEKNRLLGNVTHRNVQWGQVPRSARYRSFSAAKSQWNPTCNHCEYLDFCAGDCPRNRVFPDHTSQNNGGNHLSSWLCSGWRRFYAHALPGLKQAAAELTFNTTNTTEQ